MPSRNTRAVSMLIDLGYPLPRIRKALHKLTGISQLDLADRLGVSRITVTATVAGTRGSARVQAAIAEVYDVPAEVLFQTETAVNGPAAGVAGACIQA